MATYNYECQNEDCKHEWEEVHPMSQAATTTCPICLKETAKRLISLSSFVLAGGGWAKEGYSNK